MASPRGTTWSNTLESNSMGLFSPKTVGFKATVHGECLSQISIHSSLLESPSYVRPPIIVSDVSRPGPMTVKWSSYAQSLTKKPMKGMLTGPVTILNWSFPRADVSREMQSKQLALALRDEVIDLEKAGIHAIQVDEPAIREGVSTLISSCHVSKLMENISYPFVVLIGTLILHGLSTPSNFQPPASLMPFKPIPTSAIPISTTFSLPSNVSTRMSSLSKHPRVT